MFEEAVSYVLDQKNHRETATVCHAFLTDPTFHRFLLQADLAIAEEIREAGCPCGGQLHQSNYRRKPRGLLIQRDDDFCLRYSLCCDQDGCRRRRTPPSLRFLGRKVYWSVFIILLTALEHGLSPRRRQALADQFDLSPKTFYRWQHWWRGTFAASAVWCEWRRLLLPPVGEKELPGALLGRLQGPDLKSRLLALLIPLLPLTSASCADWRMGKALPQKMG